MLHIIIIYYVLDLHIILLLLIITGNHLNVNISLAIFLR